MKKITVFCLMLISVLAIDNLMVNILKDYENKCNAGDEMACGMAGGVYDFAFEVYGVKQDYGKAMKFYKKGCDNGNYRSCNNLGSMYDNEKGVKQDYKKAFELYTKSCDIGNDALGCRNLGFLYINGLGTEVDTTRAVIEGLSRLKKSCDTGNGDFLSCEIVGEVNLNFGNQKAAMENYQRACNAGANDQSIQSFEGDAKFWKATCAMYELLKQGSR